MQPRSPYMLVDDRSSLARLCEQLVGAELVALDTEFVRESTYFPKLCLIQLATDKLTACVDCLTAGDLAPLFDWLLASNVTWIVHSGRQDIEVVWYASGTRPSVVYDTQIAAALLGAPAQIGLREILGATLNVAIGKSLTRTNWAKRPLPEAALQYAIDDVRYLLPLWRALSQQLVEKQRFEWFVEDCGRASEAPLEPDLPTLFQRTKGTGRLRNDCVDAALALLSWREERARTADRPRRWIMTDESLVALAARRPGKPAELSEIVGLPERTIAKSGDAILAAIAARSERRFTSVAVERNPPGQVDTALLKSLQAEIRTCAARLGIEAEVVAAKRDIVGHVLGTPPERLISGWRAAQLRLPANRSSRN